MWCATVGSGGVCEAKRDPVGAKVAEENLATRRSVRVDESESSKYFV